MKISLSFIVLLTFLLLVFLRSAFAELRLILYMLVPFILYLVFLKSTAKFVLSTSGKHVFYITAGIFLIVVLSKIPTLGVYQTRFLKEALFIVSPVFSVGILFLLIRDVRRVHEELKVLFVICFILSLVQFGRHIPELLALNVIEIVQGTTSETESTLAFFLGTFALYFFLEKKWGYFAVALLLVIVSFKRIVLLAVIACVILSIVFLPVLKLAVRRRYAAAALLALVNLAIAHTLFMLSSGAYDDLIYNLTGVPANAFFMGRLYTYSLVADYVSQLSLLPRGLGYTSGLLEQIGSDLILLHSDILKIYLEFGVLLGLTFFVMLYSYALVNVRTFLLMIYFNILMLTDNTMIYFDFTFFLIFIIVLYSYEKSPMQLESATDSKAIQA